MLNHEGMKKKKKKKKNMQRKKKIKPFIYKNNQEGI